MLFTPAVTTDALAKFFFSEGVVPKASSYLSTRFDNVNECYYGSFASNTTVPRKKCKLNIHYGCATIHVIENPPKADHAMTPITPPPKLLKPQMTPVLKQHMHYDAHGNEITSTESTIDQRIKEARMIASAHHPTPQPGHEMPQKSFSDGPRFRSTFEPVRTPFGDAARPPLRFEKSSDTLAETTGPRLRFENPLEPFRERPRFRPEFERPREQFDEKSHPRFERPIRPPFDDMRGKHPLTPRMEIPREAPRHRFRDRSPPPHGFHPRSSLPPPPVRRRSANEALEVELALLRDEQRREDALLRDVALLDDIERRSQPRPWSVRLRGSMPHFRPRGPRGPPPFRSMRPRMRF